MMETAQSVDNTVLPSDEGRCPLGQRGLTRRSDNLYRTTPPFGHPSLSKEGTARRVASVVEPVTLHHA